jgi:hypothetical protein
VKGSAEWLAELQRCADAVQRLGANNKDMDALEQLSDAGTKIGLVKKLPNAAK